MIISAYGIAKAIGLKSARDEPMAARAMFEV
jgi:hypothetical protein